MRIQVPLSGRLAVPFGGLGCISGHADSRGIKGSQIVLGGGMALTRTWNSLWTLTNPPETSGIFGHNWRSDFEEP